MSDQTKYGYIQDGKVYLRGYMDFPDREIGVVKESEEASLQYFIDRFERVKQKVEEVEQAIHESTNKGSFLMKLVHMREYLAQYNGLGDFESLFVLIDRLEADIRDYVSNNRQKNLQIKQALLEEARLFKTDTDWDATSEKIKELKMKWIRTGSAPKEDEDDLCQEFDDILNDFFARRKAFYEEERRISNERMNEYGKLIREIRHLYYNKDRYPNARDRVIAIQKEWKDVGKIDKWKYLKIWKKYKQEVDRFFGNANPDNDNPPQDRPQYSRNPSQRGTYSQNRSYTSDRPQRYGQSTSSQEGGQSSFPQRKPAFVPAEPPKPLTEAEILERKKVLCIEIEKITDETPDTPLDVIKKRQAEWKNLGVITNNEDDKELNNRFRAACNEIFEHNFLIKDSQSRFEDYDHKTKFEQLKIKIKILKETIKNDENELQRMELEQRNSRNVQQNSQKQLEYVNQVNKIKTKKRLAKKLQNQLISNYY